jgi:hypothetical protein
MDLIPEINLPIGLSFILDHMNMMYTVNSAPQKIAGLFFASLKYAFSRQSGFRVDRVTISISDLWATLIRRAVQRSKMYRGGMLWK